MGSWAASLAQLGNLIILIIMIVMIIIMIVIVITIIIVIIIIMIILLLCYYIVIRALAQLPRPRRGPAAPRCGGAGGRQPVQTLKPFYHLVLNPKTLKP